MTQVGTAAYRATAYVEPPSTGMRFETLDSWRGICALLVVLMHFPAASPITESPLVRNAYLFVDYFFVLSGFVIAHGYGPKLMSGVDYLRFVIVRAGRIYPLHAAVLVLFVAFEILRWCLPALRGVGAAPFTEGNSLLELLSSLALLNGLGVEIPTHLEWAELEHLGGVLDLSPVWRRRACARPGRVWLALLPAVFAGPVLLYAFSPDFMDATWNFGFIRCLYGFSLGALLYQLAGPGLLDARRQGAAGYGSIARWTTAEFVIAAAVVAFVGAAGHKPVSVAAPFLFALALWIFAKECGLISRVLKTRGFLWLGMLSYGIYMVHIFVQGRLINLATLVERLTGAELVGPFRIGGEDYYGFGVGGEVFGTLMVVIMTALVIATAFAGYVLVERPFQRLSKKLAAGLSQPRMPKDPLIETGVRVGA